AKVITPAESMWMAGYAARTKPSEGKVHDLYVKALALEDADKHRLVLLTSDLIGLPRSLSDAVAKEVTRQTGLPRECLILTASHPLCGRVPRDSLIDMYDMPEEYAQKAPGYPPKLQGWMVEPIVAALKALKPVRLAHGKGTAGFAMNRR